LGFTIGKMADSDWAEVSAIYAEGLATGLASFTTTPPGWKDWHAGHLKLGRLVARPEANGLSGFAALAPVPDT
jgi:L-amino acid N-acyltransferase YncA